MKTKLFYYIEVILLTVCVVSLPLGCASTPQSKADSHNAVTKYELTNGIPVYVQQDKNNQLVSVVLTIAGGVDELPPEKSGLDMALGRMMTSGSSSYSYNDIQSLEFKTSSSLYGAVTLNGTMLSLKCISYYLKDMLPVLLDGYLHPVYEQEQFDTMMTVYGQRIHRTLNNPLSLLTDTVSKQLYKGTAYETSVSPLEDTIGAITIPALKELHAKKLDADRLAVFVVGDCDVSYLLSQLNDTIGTLSHLGVYTLPQVQGTVHIGDKPVILTNQNINGSAYMLQEFVAPPVYSTDYAAAVLAGEIYNDVLYQVVREKHGACYTPSSSISGSLINNGQVLLYRVSDFANAATYVKESESLMAADTIPQAIAEDGSYIYTTIEDVLEEYKNRIVNHSYSSQLTYSGLSSNYAGNYLKFGDYTKSQLFEEQIRTVTVADVRRTFDTYWIKGKKQWFVMAGTDVADKIRF